MRETDWLSVNDAAELLDVTVGWIRHLLLTEQLAGKKLNGRAWMIDRREVERYARKNGVKLAAIAG